MNSQLIFVVLLYLLIILITHFSLKHRSLSKLGHKVSTIPSQLTNDLDEEISGDEIEVEDDELVLPSEEIQRLDAELGVNQEMNTIVNFDETQARKELLNHLDSENIKADNYKGNFLKNTGEINIKGSNFYTDKSKENFASQRTDNSNMFNFPPTDIYSFDPVPTNKSELKDNTNDHLLKGDLKKSKLFGNVEAYDDFDAAYASLI